MTPPDLDSEFRIDRSIVEEYRREHHVTIRGLATREELQPYRGVIAALTAEGVTSSTFIRLEDVWRRSEVARRLVFARRFARVAAQLLGVASVQLSYDQALFKLAGSRRTAWHTDRPYFTIAKDDALTMWLPLVDVPMYMGPICFASRSHEMANADDQAWVGSARALTARIGRRWHVSSEPFRVGDASFHGSRILHSAGPNRSKKVRETLTVVYYPAVRDTPEDEANTELHPILYG
jgi:ectoine hydroxylase-related dioxygenase (phytanoyl-CoA dioxygenase family)